MSHLVIIALGSNVSRDCLIRSRQLMEAWLTVTGESDIITTSPIGMPASPDFHNQLLTATTRLSLDSLTHHTKETEAALGRSHGTGVVTIDIDIMRYDDIILHPADWNREYIKNLYCQIQKTTQL